jgi:hypothetical protein
MGGMNKSAPIEIFKPGKHTAMNGAVIDFTESDLQQMVEAYDPALHEAPLVIGHPKTDAPRYGGVGSLDYADGKVLADPQDVLPEFAEVVNKKLFNKVSASFYLPDSPSNPKPGGYYLRHVGFLGAQPPAIKGLNPNGISFSDSEEGVVEFGDWGDRISTRIFRKIRDWLIDKFGLEEADKVINEWDVQSLDDYANESPAVTGLAIPSFSEPNPKGDEMSAEDKARLEALEAENRDLKEREQARIREAAHTQNVSFAESLVQEGKLLPAQKHVAVATLDLIGSQDTPLEFGEGDDKGTLTLDSVKTFLQSLPQQVNFSETGGGNPDTELDDKEVATRAREYKAKKAEAGENISYAEAVDAVLAGKGK